MFTKNTYIEVDYHDLEDLLKKEYSDKYDSLIANEEWSNDSQHSFDVLPKKLDKYAKRQIQKGDFTYRLSDLLNDMCLRRVIEEGKYLVRICW